MIIRSITLSPFAKFNDKEVELEDGLNVIVGPNEAGKSTIMKALQMGLLEDTELTEKQFEQKAQLYLPANKGNVLRVNLDISANGTEYNVDKVWKYEHKNGKSSLRSDDGTEYSGDEKVQELINECLPVKQATLEQVLLTHQLGFHTTVENIRKSDTTRQELDDLLRKLFMETGGVSIDRFRELVETRYEEYYDKWNVDKDAPKDNRGIENRFKKGTGKVIEAFYDKEEVRKELEQVKEWEEKLNQLNSKIENLSDELEEKESMKKEYAGLKDKVQEKAVKEEKLENVKQKLKDLRETSQEWTEKKQRAEKLPDEIEKKKKQLKELEEEKQKAEQAEKDQKFKEKFEKIRALKHKKEKAKKELEETKEVTEEDVKSFRSIRDDLKEAETKLEGTKLRYKLKAVNKGSYRITKADQDEKEIVLDEGEVDEDTVQGRLNIKTENLELVIKSGEEDVDQILQEKEKSQEKLNELKDKYEVESLDKLDNKRKLFEDKRRAFQESKEELDTALGEDEFENLKEKYEELEKKEEVRSSDKIAGDIARAEATEEQKKQEKEKIDKEIEEYKEKHESLEQLQEKIGVKANERNELSSEIEDLPDIPENFENAKEFHEKLEHLEEEIESLREEIQGKKVEQAECKGKLGDRSVDMMNEKLEEKEQQFQKVKQEAEALSKVKAKTHEILDSIEDHTFENFKKNFIYWMNLMTGDRFQDVRMDKELPDAFVTEDGEELHYKQLSFGTRDNVSLALRLAMAQFFLKDQDGFLVLDDPLVAMDEMRQEGAIEAIQEFAEDKQVIFFTCHHDQAKKLDGSKVQLNSK